MHFTHFHAFCCMGQAGGGVQLSTLPRHLLSPGWPCHQLEHQLLQSLLPSSEKSSLALGVPQKPPLVLLPQPDLCPQPGVPPQHGQGGCRVTQHWRNDTEHPAASSPSCPPGRDTGAAQTQDPQRWPGGRTRRLHGLSPCNPCPEDTASEGAPGQPRRWGAPFQGSQPGTTARMLAADGSMLENPGFIFI